MKFENMIEAPTSDQDAQVAVTEKRSKLALLGNKVNLNPNKAEKLGVLLNVNENKDCKGDEEWAIYVSMPWIVEEVDDKI